MRSYRSENKIDQFQLNSRWSTYLDVLDACFHVDHFVRVARALVNMLADDVASGIDKLQKRDESDCVCTIVKNSTHECGSYSLTSHV